MVKTTSRASTIDRIGQLRKNIDGLIDIIINEWSQTIQYFVMQQSVTMLFTQSAGCCLFLRSICGSII